MGMGVRGWGMLLIIEVKVKVVDRKMKEIRRKVIIMWSVNGFLYSSSNNVKILKNISIKYYSFLKVCIRKIIPKLKLKSSSNGGKVHYSIFSVLHGIPS